MNITSWVFVYGTIDGKPMRWQMTVEAYNKLLQRINNDHNIVW
jgi:hypothetical protein